MSKILFIRAGAIGDFVLTLPILEAVRERDEKAEITILGYPHIAELAVGRRLAQESRRVESVEWAPLFSDGGELRDSESRFLREFDRVICVWPDATGVIRKNLLGAGARDVISIEPMPPAGVHAVDHVAAQCSKSGLTIKHVEPHLYPSERDRWWAERFMRVSIAGQAALMGIGIGSGSPRKNWPAASFAELAKWWIGKRGHVLLVGGEADEKAIEEFRAQLPDERVFEFLNEPLTRMAAVIERCELFVGNDSGPTHIAAAVRVPTVALFGPTDPAQWRPLAPRVIAIRGEDGRMERITAEQVRQAAAELLKLG